MKARDVLHTKAIWLQCQWEGGKPQETEAFGADSLDNKNKNRPWPGSSVG